MSKLKKIAGIVLGICVSCTAVADKTRTLSCNTIPETFPGIKHSISKMAPDFDWKKKGCEIVATQSKFPKEHTPGVIKFEKGLQVFVYQDNALKYICLPGWMCKAW